MKKVFIWFSFGADSMPLAESIRAVKRIAPDGDGLVVVEDSQNRFDCGFRDWLRRQGVNLVMSNYPRRPAGKRTILGVENLAGQYEHFDRIIAENGAEALVKVDSDVIFRSLDHLASDADVIHFRQEGWPLCGPTYFLSKQAVSVLHESIDDRERFRREFPVLYSDSVCEDKATFVLASKLLGEDRMRGIQAWSARGGFTDISEHPYCYYNYARSTPLKVYLPFGIVCFGNRSQLGAQSEDQARRMTGLKMRQFNDLIDAQKS